MVEINYITIIIAMAAYLFGRYNGARDFVTQMPMIASIIAENSVLKEKSKDAFDALEKLQEEVKKRFDGEV